MGFFKPTKDAAAVPEEVAAEADRDPSIDPGEVTSTSADALREPGPTTNLP